MANDTPDATATAEKLAAREPWIAAANGLSVYDQSGGIVALVCGLSIEENAIRSKLISSAPAMFKHLEAAKEYLLARDSAGALRAVEAGIEGRWEE